MIFAIIISLLGAGYFFMKRQKRQSNIRYLIAAYYLDPKKLKPLSTHEVLKLRHTLESLRKNNDWETITKHAQPFKWKF